MGLTWVWRKLYSLTGSQAARCTGDGTIAVKQGKSHVHKRQTQRVREPAQRTFYSECGERALHRCVLACAALVADPVHILAHHGRAVGGTASKQHRTRGKVPTTQAAPQQGILRSLQHIIIVVLLSRQGWSQMNQACSYTVQATSRVRHSRASPLLNDVW